MYTYKHVHVSVQNNIPWACRWYQSLWYWHWNKKKIAFTHKNDCKPHWTVTLYIIEHKLHVRARCMYNMHIHLHNIIIKYGLSQERPSMESTCTCTCMLACACMTWLFWIVHVPCHVGIEDSGWGPMLLARQALTETATTVTAHERLQK